MKESELEKNLKKIEELRTELNIVINTQPDVSNGILDYEESYKKWADKRENLKIELNYYQNQSIIEQNKLIISYNNEILHELREAKR